MAHFKFIRLCAWYLACACFGISDVACAQSCEPQYAPATFPFRADPSSPKGHPVNVGIVTKGFVALRDTKVVHGIDVSKWQDQTDFTSLRQCLEVVDHSRGIGPMHAPFVYVRLTAGEDPDNETLFRAHWYNARNQNLYAGPYHSLVVKDSPTATASMNEGDFTKIRNENLMSADVQANTFVKRFGHLLLADPLRDVAPGDHGKPYLPIVLALMERPQQRYGDDDRRVIGKAYGASACRWIETVHRHPSFAGQRIIVFTSASIFSDYDLGNAPCDLRAGGIWISLHTSDGSRDGVDRTEPTARAIADLCKTPDGTNRCIFQQYTSYGGFALFGKDSPLDLDRFYGSEADLTALLQHARHPEEWK
ncbi:GH25 family lysozyme [Burkholderia sp. Bp9090]|uniref:GH25 family lysozyme n=1 Tax=Burkholderia sp. Bp9090 TaxID=2184567 RepID=UPI000F5E769F|nr:GH25 family lysozyme [Burkholderia sp. Bp9090]